MKAKAVPLYVQLKKDVMVSLIILLNILTQVGLSKSLIYFIGDWFKTSYPSPGCIIVCKLVHLSFEAYRVLSRK